MRQIMHMVVLLLLILILLSKTIYAIWVLGYFLLFVITWLVKYGRDFKIWKDSSIEEMTANGLAVGALALKI